MCVGDEGGVGAGALAHGSLGGERGEAAASVTTPHVRTDELLKLRDRSVVNGLWLIFLRTWGWLGVVQRSRRLLRGP